MTETLYKIVPAPLWDEALEKGRFDGAPVDLADGYIHLSAAGQVRETAAKHFAGQRGLLLVALEAGSLGAALRWEPSRGGALFPHLYAPLDPAAILSAEPLELAEDGTHRFPDGFR